MSEYKIYPPIGIARVGNAPKQFYIGPEEYRGLPENTDGRPFTEADFRDGSGKLCRQAARFRIYRTGKDGKPEEVVLKNDGDIESITWTVHLANKKASWYAFQTNEGEDGYASNHPKRNPDSDNRQSLIIDPGPRSIHGINAGPVPCDKAGKPKGAYFPPSPLYPNGDDGKPQSIDTLGELHTDDHGRLLVLGGFGISGTTSTDPQLPGYANNDDWWDDTSDGTVSAVIKLKHQDAPIIAAPARVLVGPPAYAPQIPNLVTLWDTIYDTAVRHGHDDKILKDGLWNAGATGYRPNFRTEIGPLLERAALYPWVTAIPPKPHDFDMVKLGTVPVKGAQDLYQGLRQWIFSFLRPPSQENVIIGKSGATMMPYLAGDNCLRPDTLTSNYLRLTDTQYFFLQQWAEGWFVNEQDSTPKPQAITRGVLENCVGGAFSPGIEMTWISRNPAIYEVDDPFRITANLNPGQLGLGFTPERMEPGDVTRYMALPWQADFNECSSQTGMDGRTLWWWPSQRPEYVYLEDPSHPKNDGVPPPPDETSGVPVAWIGTDFDQTRDDYVQFADNVQMVQYWQGLGFVLEKDVKGKRKFVEVARTLERPFFPK